MRAAMVVDSFLGGFAQPEAEGHGAALEVVVEAAERFHLGLLDDVGCVDARPHPTIKPQLDSLTQFAAVAVEEVVEGVAMAGGDLHEKSLSFGRISEVIRR